MRSKITKRACSTDHTLLVAKADRAFEISSSSSRASCERFCSSSDIAITWPSHADPVGSPHLFDFSSPVQLDSASVRFSPLAVLDHPTNLPFLLGRFSNETNAREDLLYRSQLSRNPLVGCESPMFELVIHLSPSSAVLAQVERVYLVVVSFGFTSCLSFRICYFRVIRIQVVTFFALSILVEIRSRSLESLRIINWALWTATRSMPAHRVAHS